MVNPKDILVITASSVEGSKIKKYLKPVSAHIVAGTNVFSDFFASWTDAFGGRSRSYQNQLTSLYNEAIEKIKLAAYELGANCVIGLSIDMDEISGKGKAMFMLTAIGTAVILEEPSTEKVQLKEENNGIIGIDKLYSLKSKKEFIDKANSGNLSLTEETWEFLTANQVFEVFPYILTRFTEAINNELSNAEAYNKFYKSILNYIDALPENKKLELLYNGIKADEKGPTALKLSRIIQDLQLYDFQKTCDILNDEKFTVQKRGVRLTTADKPFYSNDDLSEHENLIQILNTNFKERGTRVMKKQLLSSKEKEMWTCECGKTNEIALICGGCNNDIYGFSPMDMSPAKAEVSIRQKISLITECIN